jgi:hypothetical protein
MRWQAFYLPVCSSFKGMGVSAAEDKCRPFCRQGCLRLEPVVSSVLRSLTSESPLQRNCTAARPPTDHSASPKGRVGVHALATKSLASNPSQCRNRSQTSGATRTQQAQLTTDGTTLPDSNTATITLQPGPMEGCPLAATPLWPVSTTSTTAVGVSQPTRPSLTSLPNVPVQIQAPVSCPLNMQPAVTEQHLSRTVSIIPAPRSAAACTDPRHTPAPSSTKEQSCKLHQLGSGPTLKSPGPVCPVPRQTYPWQVPLVHATGQPNPRSPSAAACQVAARVGRRLQIGSTHDFWRGKQQVLPMQSHLSATSSGCQTPSPSTHQQAIGGMFSHNVSGSGRTRLPTHYKKMSSRALSEARPLPKQNCVHAFECCHSPLRTSSRSPLRASSRSPLRASSRSPLRASSRSPLRASSRSPLCTSSRSRQELPSAWSTRQSRSQEAVLGSPCACSTSVLHSSQRYDSSLARQHTIRGGSATRPEPFPPAVQLSGLPVEDADNEDSDDSITVPRAANSWKRGPLECALQQVEASLGLAVHGMHDSSAEHRPPLCRWAQCQRSAAARSARQVKKDSCCALEERAKRRIWEALDQANEAECKVTRARQVSSCKLGCGDKRAACSFLVRARGSATEGDTIWADEPGVYRMEHAQARLYRWQQSTCHARLTRHRCHLQQAPSPCASRSIVAFP